MKKKNFSIILLLTLLLMLVSCGKKLPRVNNKDIDSVYVIRAGESGYTIPDGIYHSASIVLRYRFKDSDEMHEKRFRTNNATVRLFKDHYFPYKINLKQYKFYYEDDNLRIKKKKYLFS